MRAGLSTNYYEAEMEKGRKGKQSIRLDSLQGMLNEAREGKGDQRWQLATGGDPFQTASPGGQKKENRGKPRRARLSGVGQARLRWMGRQQGWAVENSGRRILRGLGRQRQFVVGLPEA